MKQHIIYECEKCGKQSKDREEIMICEAAPNAKKPHPKSHPLNISYRSVA